MNEEQRYVTHFTGSDGKDYQVKDPDVESGCIAGNYVYVNASGNLEVSSDPAKPETPVELEDDAKLNLVAKTDIQVKPGTSGTVEFDCEKSSSVAKDAYEIPFKVCNGSLPKATRVVGTKWNTAQWIFDTQKVNSTSGQGEYDPKNFIMQWRLDKWNSGVPATDKGPIEVKLKAKSFDIRCHGTNPGGGIALQPSGADSQGHENKVKFESSRTSTIDGATKTWGNEGGKGLEFGTFNNDHSSLFTGTYRFRGISSIYPSVRLNPVVDGDKTDYPTQPDDFKDVLPLNADFASWADVVNVVRYIKSQQAYLDWRTNNKLVFPAGTLSTAYEGWDDSNMQVGFTTHQVFFSATHGSVTAKVDNVPIDSGDEVLHGKTVVFTITPDEGYEYTGTNPESVVVTAEVSKVYACTFAWHGLLATPTGECTLYHQAETVWTNLQYSTDGVQWNTIQGGSENAITFSTPIMLRGNNPNGFRYYDADSAMSVVGSRLYFGGSGTVVLSGHLSSLIDQVGDITVLPHEEGSYYYGVFANCFASYGTLNTNITSAANLIIPSPDPNSVYGYAYTSMFEGCIGLVKAPAIPSCNGVMRTSGDTFDNLYIFKNCVALNEVHCNATSLAGEYACDDWLASVAETGDFYGKAAANWPTGPHGIPSGWTFHEE